MSQLEDLNLEWVILNSTVVSCLINAMTSTHNKLQRLILRNIRIGSSDYQQLIRALTGSKITEFRSQSNPIDDTVAQALADLLIDTKSLKCVQVEDPTIMSVEASKMLVKAMNDSQVDVLEILEKFEQHVTGCTFPVDRVVFVPYDHLAPTCIW